MAYSYIRYTGNGTQTDFSFAFPYFSTSNISVTVDGVVAPFTWVNSSTVKITTAPASGAVIFIQRTTPKDITPVNFVDGSVLLEADLDTLALFSLYAAQESIDEANKAIKLNLTGNWEAQGNRISNIADPSSLQDAVTKNYFENVYTPQLDAKVVASAASAASAAGSASAAASSAASASTSAATATTKANESGSSATSAAGSASAASISATSAAGSATTATTKASEASSSAGAAATSATGSAASAVISSTKASEAVVSAGTATTKASEASSSATTATTKASEASSSAGAAATSASSATSSEAVAITKASESAVSATSAAASAASAALISFGSLIMTPNKISASINIPDGFNAILIDTVEISPDVIITGLGNSTLRGI